MKWSPEEVVASHNAPGRTGSPMDDCEPRFCCQIRYKVLPGRHSHRSTTLDRNERTPKSGFARVNVDPASVIETWSPVRVTLLYSCRSTRLGAGSSPKR